LSAAYRCPGSVDLHAWIPRNPGQPSHLQLGTARQRDGSPIEFETHRHGSRLQPSDSGSAAGAYERCAGSHKRRACAVSFMPQLPVKTVSFFASAPMPGCLNRSLTDLLGIPACACHDSILSRNGASGNPGAVHVALCHPRPNRSVGLASLSPATGCRMVPPGRRLFADPRTRLPRRAPERAASVSAIHDSWPQGRRW
jgi:hypothetical protein